MPLNAERKKQLDGIVANLASQNAPEADVKAIVDDFVGKYGNEAPAPSAPAPTKAPPKPYTGRESLEQVGPSVRPADRLSEPETGVVGYLKGLYKGITDPLARIPSDIADIQRRSNEEQKRMAEINTPESRAAGVSSVFGSGARMLSSGIGNVAMSALGGANALLGGIPAKVGGAALRRTAEVSPVDLGGLARKASEEYKKYEEDMTPEGVNRRAALGLGMGIADVVGVGLGGAL